MGSTVILESYHFVKHGFDYASRWPPLWHHVRHSVDDPLYVPRHGTVVRCVLYNVYNGVPIDQSMEGYLAYWQVRLSGL